MSPTEFDLRAALRDGEGDEPSADRIIGAVRTQRAARRTRVLTAAATVVLVAGAVTGGAYLVHSGNNENAGGTSADTANGRRSSNGSLNNQPEAAAGAASAPSFAVECPPSFPRTFLPGGGSPGQFGSGGRLFTGAVDSITICSYATGATASSRGSSTREVVSGAQADALVSSIENASRVRRVYPCPAVITGDTLALVLIPTTADGTALRTITTTLTRPACNVQVTNGTAVRYNWAPGPKLVHLLQAAAAGTSSSLPTGSLPSSTGSAPAAPGSRPSGSESPEPVISLTPSRPRVDGSPPR